MTWDQCSAECAAVGGAFDCVDDECQNLQAYAAFGGACPVGADDCGAWIAMSDEASEGGGSARPTAALGRRPINLGAATTGENLTGSGEELGANMWGPNNGNYGRVDATWNDGPCTQLLPCVCKTSGVTYDQVARLIPAESEEWDLFGPPWQSTAPLSWSGPGATTTAAATGRGAVYVFHTNDNGASYDRVAKLTAGDATSWSEFGWSVAIDGTTVVVGAYQLHQSSGSGSAYVYHTTDDWDTHTETKLTAAAAAADDVFGFSVAIDGATIVVGAPRATTPARTRALSCLRCLRIRRRDRRPHQRAPDARTDARPDAAADASTVVAANARPTCRSPRPCRRPLALAAPDSTALAAPDAGARRSHGCAGLRRRLGPARFRLATPTPKPTPRPTPVPSPLPSRPPTPSPSSAPSPRPTPRPSMHPTPAPSPTKSDAAAVAEAYAECLLQRLRRCRRRRAPTPTQMVVQITSSVMLQGIVAVVFNADKDMQMAFAQSIIDGVGGLFRRDHRHGGHRVDGASMYWTFTPTYSPSRGALRERRFDH